MPVILARMAVGETTAEKTALFGDRPSMQTSTPHATLQETTCRWQHHQLPFVSGVQSAGGRAVVRMARLLRPINPNRTHAGRRLVRIERGEES
jgi:hypothetical protein